MSETGQFVKVANQADVPEGSVQVITALGKRIALCNYKGQFFAIDDRCTHDNGPLGEGELTANGQIECPRHGARFDIHTGKAMCLPAVGAVSTYKVDVRGGEIWLAPVGS
jgi:3-phenylpropionate/trans-cinnamate dioxygenase ferredoxin subunit